jgi:hypothetical protein
MSVTQFYVKKLWGRWCDATWGWAWSEDAARKWMFMHQGVDVYSVPIFRKLLLQLGKHPSR